ncbi:MAG: hypothetical protein OYG31_00865 [Candidatus Kaiserbacteria bacterium]|nr:hypothetical protein [Candidatus Kaiserbacteria bacterium]
MNEYHIAQSFKTLLKVYGVNGQKYDDRSHPDSLLTIDNLKVGSISDRRIVAYSVKKAETWEDALNQFLSETDKYLSVISFLKQTALEKPCGVAIYKEGAEYAGLLVPVYESLGMSVSPFCVEQIKSLVDHDGIPCEFFKYWRDAQATPSYPGKILLMFSALEALEKKKDCKRYEIIDKIVEGGEGERKKIVKFRGRLVHGGYFDSKESVVLYEVLHKRVMEYIAKEVFGDKVPQRGPFSKESVSEIVSPQRHGDKIGHEFFVTFQRSDEKEIDVIESLSYLKERVEGSIRSTPPSPFKSETYKERLTLFEDMAGY